MLLDCEDYGPVNVTSDHEPLTPTSSRQQWCSRESTDRRRVLASIGLCFLGAVFIFAVVPHGAGSRRREGLRREHGFIQAQQLVTRDSRDRVESTNLMEIAAVGEDGKPCETARFGSECYDRTMWVMRVGIFQHPDWYPGITVLNTSEEVQHRLHTKATREGNCTAPCPIPLDPSANVSKSVDSAWGSMAVDSEDDLTESLIGTVAQAVVTQLACNTEIEVSKKPTSTAKEERKAWNLNASEIEHCFQELLALKMVKLGDDKLERNWCWVGWKEFGCHRHFNDHLTWAEMQSLAIDQHKTFTRNFSQPYDPLQNPEMCDLQAFGGTRLWTKSDWTVSRRWFQEKVAVYVLSLKTSTARRATIKTRLDALHIAFEFVDGVDLREPGAFAAAQKEGLIPEYFNLSRAQTEAYSARNDMGTAGSIAGTVGCAAAHFRAQATGFIHDAKLLTLVFEDDVFPVEDFIPKVWKLVNQELPCDWQAVSLSSRCPFGKCVSPHLTRVQPDVNEPAWRCRHGVNYGFQGMLYRTGEIANLQRQWKPVVFDELRPHCLDVDVALASISDKVGFYAVPSVQSPGFLHELAEGSSRVDINFEEMKTTVAASASDRSSSSDADASTSTSSDLVPISLFDRMTTSPMPTDADDGKQHNCNAYGCIEYNPGHSCQCNPECRKYDSCCFDYEDYCPELLA